MLNEIEIRPPIAEICNPTIPCVPEPAIASVLLLGLLVLLAAIRAKSGKGL